MQALSQTNTGDTCTIKWMFGVPEILETMRNMDIKEGSTIQVIQKCRDWLIIGSNNRRLAVGKKNTALLINILSVKLYLYYANYFILNSIVTLNRSPSRYSLNSPP